MPNVHTTFTVPETPVSYVAKYSRVISMMVKG